MNFDDYQKDAVSTAFYPKKGDNLYYPTLGLAGEAGEVCEKIKKIMRDNDGHMGPYEREDIARELGDVLWYIANLCNELDLDLSYIAITNILKLQSRKMRETLKGSGDNR